MYVRDLVGNEYVCQATTTHNLSLNGEQSISFTLEYTKPNALFIDDIAEMWEVVDDNDVEHKIVLVSRKAQGDRPFVEVRAVPLFFDSFDSLRIYDEYNEHMTATRAFSLIFEDTPFNYILVGNFAAVEWEGFGAGEPRLETFKRALERYKAEFRIVGNTVYIEELIGRDTQFMYRHRLNASNIVVETDATGYWTYAKGYGDFGNEGTGDGESSDWKDAKLTDEYTSPLASIPGIGIRHGPPIKDGRITDKTTMQNSLKALVDGSLKISISADIHDLRRQGYALGQPELGDRVFVIDERIGLHEEVRVSNIAITKDWRGNVLDLNLTIGSPSVVKRHQANISTAIKQITEIVEGVRKIPYNVLDNAIIEATKALQNAQTELQFTSNGILAIDKNDPNMVTLMNSAGLGVSRDGGATFRNAITGFGINADVITTGTMLANRIAGGILTSLNGNTEFDLNEGNLTMQNANFMLGNGAIINFTSSGNKIQFSSTDEGVTRTSGTGVGRGVSGRPIAYIGATGSSSLSALHEYFSGFIGVTTKSIDEGSGNQIVGRRSLFVNTAINWDRGLTLDWHNNPTITPINGGSYDYTLGSPANKFHRIYVDSIRTNNTFTIGDSYGNGGFYFTTDWNQDSSNDVTNLVFRGRNYGSSGGAYRYNLGASNAPFSFGYISSVYADYLRGELQGSSAEKFKKNIEDMDVENSLDFIRNTDIKMFDWNDTQEGDSSRKQVGFILDNLNMENDYLVKADNETIKKDNIIFMHQHVIQYLDRKLTDAEEEIKSLNKRIDKLELNAT